MARLDNISDLSGKLLIAMPASTTNVLNGL